MRHGNLLMVLACLLFFPFATLHGAQTAKEQIAGLKERIAVLEARLARMEVQMAREREDLERIQVADSTAPDSPRRAATEQSKNLQLSADFRYRLDTIDDSAVIRRHVHKIRARAGAVAKLNSFLSAGFGFSTGGFANDSGNQTLGEGFSRKQVGLDLAYFEWTPIEYLILSGGKMINPFYRSGRHHLLYDNDLRPEGLAIALNAGRFFGNASAFLAEKREVDSDSWWQGIQMGYRGRPADGLQLIAGSSYFEITNARSRPPIFSPYWGQGNQLDVHGNYLYGFSLVEWFGELQADFSDYSVTCFFDYVTNISARHYADGYSWGLGYRRKFRSGSWNVSYVYQDLQANAVIGAFADSDFGGGTTDSRGHVLRTTYEFPKGWYVAVRGIVGKRGKAAGQPRDYKRMQIDFGLSY